MNYTERSEHTLIQLEKALERLLDGKPLKTKNDGRINISRINDEAGLSSGAIYYYKDFIESAKITIEKIKNKNSISKINSSVVTVKRLRAERDNEKKLKKDYYMQRDKIKKFCDNVVSQNIQLEFTLFEALEKITRLEKELSLYKVTSINHGK